MTRRKTLAEMAEDSSRQAAERNGRFWFASDRERWESGYYRGYLAGRRAERRAAKKRMR